MSLPPDRTPAYAPVGPAARIAPLWAQPLVLVAVFVVAALIMVIATFGAGTLAAMNGRFVSPAALETWWAAAPLTMLLFATWGLLTLWWLRKAERRAPESAGVAPLRRGDAACWVGGALWAALLAGVLLLVTGERPDEAGQSTAGLGQMLAVLAASALMVAVLATTEEWVFRGWALSAAAARVGRGWALALTSVLFGAAHVFPWEWVDPARLLSFLSFACMGAAFGAVALRRRSVWSAAAFHTGYNSGLVLLSAVASGFQPEAMWEGVTTAGSGFDDWRPAAALLGAQAVLALTAVLWWRMSPDRAARWAAAAQARFNWRSRPRSSSSAR